MRQALSTRISSSKKPGPTGPTGVRRQLDRILLSFPPSKRLSNDPIRFPRARLLAHAARADIESVALLSAMLSYGRVSHFMPVLDRILAGCPPPYPAGFIRPLPGFSWPGYRLSSPDEVYRFSAAIARVVNTRGGLWEAFQPGWMVQRSVWDGLHTLHQALCKAAGFSLSRGLRHLLSNPVSGSCAKRWMMFLRWMVRPDDGVDLGQWLDVPPSALIMPIDRHIGRFARRWGWTKRLQDDRRAAEEITAAIKKISPDDPLQYDFAICHLGIDGLCTHGKDRTICKTCGLCEACWGRNSP